MAGTFEQLARRIIKKIPRGRVATYGLIATLAGSPRGARQVVRVLNLYSEKDGLPWHRVINREGKISLGKGHGYEMQKAMLEDEGVIFGLNDTVDLKRFLWQPRGTGV